MRQFCVVTIALLCFAVSFGAQDLGNQPPKADSASETVVYPVRAGSASDLANSLTRLFPDHQFIASHETNALLIRVDAKAKDELLDVLSQLDRPKLTIIVHAYLLRSHGAPLSPDETASLSGPHDQVLERIKALQKDDQISIQNRIELTAIENQRAMVQVGQQASVVSGTTTSPRGRSNVYQRVETGTIFSVEARTAPDDAIVMEVNFEKSEIDSVAELADTEDPLPSSISTLTHQTTVQLKDGEAVLAGTLTRKPASTSGHSYLVVTANVRDITARRATASAIRSGGSNPSAASRSPRASRSGSTPPPRRSDRGFGVASLPPERFESMARSMFDRADLDRNGILSGDELNGRGVRGVGGDLSNAKEITFAQYKQAMAARLGIEIPQDTKPAATTDRSEAKKPPREPRYLAYFTKLLEKYDSNSDGKLTVEEWSKMRSNPADADVDGDESITAEELTDWGLRK